METVEEAPQKKMEWSEAFDIAFVACLPSTASDENGTATGSCS